MGTTNKKSGKKKGPKGKKARAKAKLERQWGETVDEEKQRESRIRPGKSRLVRSFYPKSAARKKDDSWTAPEEKRTIASDNDQPSHSSDDDDDEIMIQDGALNQLLESIKKKSRKGKRLTRNQQRTIESDAESVESEENSRLEAEGDMPETGSSSESRGSDEELDMSDPEDEPEDVILEDMTNDPFSSRFNRNPLPEDDNALSEMLESCQAFKKVGTLFLDSSLELQCSGPSDDHPRASASSSEQAWQDFAKSLFKYNRKILRQTWKRINRTILKNDPDRDSEVTVKDRLLSALQCVVYPSLARYADVLLTAETPENRCAVNNVLYLHVLNHVLTSRGRIQRNNKRVKELEESEDRDGFDEDKLRDQGYTRATVLVLLPTRGTCHSFLTEMIGLLGNAARVDNMERFEAEYGPIQSEQDDDKDEGKRNRRKEVLERKGPAWKELFGDQSNDDDDFKIGISLTPKAAGIHRKEEKTQTGAGGVSVKLYSDFYKSDMIFASPLGLKMLMDGDDGEVDADFLSSIEICVVSRSDVLLMQNWDHVNSVLDTLNQQPRKNNDTDFSRVRQYLLAGQAKYWRQLIVTSSFCDPHIQSTFKRHSKSIAGRSKLKCRTPIERASLCNVMVKAKQVFQRVGSSSFLNQGSDRLRYFEDRILPQLRRLKQNHTMVFIPSYFDFVSVRNLLLKKDMDFVSVTEYARVSEVSRGRARFLQGRKPILLYTGRCHFFSRHTIKGVRHLVLFGLPEHPEFYSDMVNALNLGLDEAHLGAPTSILALFTKYDALALERIVGSKHCERMIKGEKATFMFCS